MSLTELQTAEYESQESFASADTGSTSVKKDLILSDEQVKALFAPIEQARTLPRKAFLSQEFFDLEIEKIFKKEWLAICFREQLTPNSVLPLEFSRMPILLTQADDGKVRAFHNVVPYDGCLAVVEAQKNLEEIITPYHGWHYDLQGKLQAIPVWDGTMKGDLKSLKGRPGDLAEVQCEVWGPLVFIKLTQEGESFAEYIAALERSLTGWRIKEALISKDEHGNPMFDSEDITGNWKTHYENWGINVLHESFVHDVYKNSPDVPRLDEMDHRTCEDHIDGNYMALKFKAHKAASTYPNLPRAHLGVGEEKPDTGYFGSIFPNLHIGVFGSMIHFIIANPMHPEQTLTTRAQFYDANVANDVKFVDFRKDMLGFFAHAGKEDSSVVEAVQKARHSPAFDSNYYSQVWDTMHYLFSQTVLKKVMD